MYRAVQNLNPDRSKAFARKDQEAMNMNTIVSEFPGSQPQETSFTTSEPKPFRECWDVDPIDFENSPGCCWRQPVKKGRAILASRQMAESA
jgi:hypothetical protein